MVGLRFRDGFTMLVPDGTPRRGEVLLLHGLTSSPAEMEGLARFLSERKLNVTVPQLSGHSGVFSELRRTPARAWIRDAEENLRTCRERNPGKPCFVAGVSLGAILALYLATRHGDQLAGVVLLSPPIVLRSFIREKGLLLLAACPDWFLNLLGTVKKKKRPPNYLAVQHEMFPVHSIAASARCFYIRELALRQLHKISCPLGILQDPDDHLLRPTAAQMLQQQISQVPIMIEFVPGGQHELTLGHSREKVFEVIGQFIERVLG